MDEARKNLQIKFIKEKIDRLDMQIQALEEKKAELVNEYQKLTEEANSIFQPIGIFNSSEMKIFLYADHVDIYDPLHEATPLRFYKKHIREIEVVLSEDEDFASLRFNPMESVLLSEAEFESNKDCSGHPTNNDGKAIYELFKTNWPENKITIRKGLNQHYY